MTFLTNVMFSRIDKFDGSIFERLYIGRGVIFGMLIGLHIWGTYIRGGGRGAHIQEGLLTGFYGTSFYKQHFCKKH